MSVLKKIKTLEQLEVLVFKEGYEFESKESKSLVFLMQPLESNQILFRTIDGQQVITSVSNLHKYFIGVKMPFPMTGKIYY
ncbi:hypothetical protein [Massilibacterium senegalense]|uniref:hypothetical protein n=1 Tax=Massilibacterium senegalense TaxID=1632858 RepID=UPI000780F30A|nr:hypothetical protein [Massilibacterium senegalense]